MRFVLASLTGASCRPGRISVDMTTPMVTTLERLGLIQREPSVAQSIQLLIPPEALPLLH